MASTTPSPSLASLASFAALVGLAALGAPAIAQTLAPPSAPASAPAAASAASPSPPADLCALPPWDESRTPRRQLAEWVEQWLPLVQACEARPAFLLSLGRALNAQGRFQEAAEHLERALLLDAQNPYARQAYALALLGVGDWQAADSLLGALIEMPQTPAPLQAQARAQQQRLRAEFAANLPSRTSSPAGQAVSVPSAVATTSSPSDAPAQNQMANWRHRQTYTLTAGGESNLLGATSSRSLTLTLPGLTAADPVLITLPLDTALRPQRGGYGQAQAAFQWQRAWAATEGSQPGQLDLYLLARQRDVPVEPQAGYTQAEMAAEYTERRGLYAASNLSVLDSRTGVRYSGMALTGGYALEARPGCDLRIGGEHQRRRYDSNPVLSSRYHGLQLLAGCAGPAAQQAGMPWNTRQAQLTLRVGRDVPEDPSRPGGPQNQINLRALWRSSHTIVEIDATGSLDGSGYSALIEQGARRRQERLTLRLEREFSLQALLQAGNGSPLTPQANRSGPILFIGIDMSQQLSNISLFKSNNLGGFLGIRFTN